MFSMFFPFAQPLIIEKWELILISLEGSPSGKFEQPFIGRARLAALVGYYSALSSFIFHIDQ